MPVCVLSAAAVDARWDLARPLATDVLQMGQCAIGATISHLAIHCS